MASWLEIVVRQLILYSLPVLVSLSTVAMMESRLLRIAVSSPFHAIGWRGTWWPLLASLAFHRGIIIALPQPVGQGLKAAGIRCTAHGLLTLLGLILYTWSIAYQPPVGLPPLHFWWAKIVMFFNLCMLCLHLLPLPGMLAGQYLAGTRTGSLIVSAVNEKRSILIITLLAASPLLDMLLGAFLVFPIYESMNNLAANFSGSR